MNLVALILAIVAAVLFGVESSRTKSLLAFGLCFLAVAWICQLTLTAEAITL